MTGARQAAVLVAMMAAVAMAVRMDAQSASTGLRQTAYIKASNPHMGDHFGNGGTLLGDSVALSGDGLTLAVGAPNESSGAKGINGNQNDTSVYSAGAVYVFTNSGGTWTQTQKLTASDGASSDSFGESVAISDDNALIGAYGATVAESVHRDIRRLGGVRPPRGVS